MYKISPKYKGNMAMLQKLGASRFVRQTKSTKPGGEEGGNEQSENRKAG